MQLQIGLMRDRIQLTLGQGIDPVPGLERLETVPTDGHEDDIRMNTRGDPGPSRYLPLR